MYVSIFGKDLFDMYSDFFIHVPTNMEEAISLQQASNQETNQDHLASLLSSCHDSLFIVSGCTRENIYTFNL